MPEIVLLLSEIYERLAGLPCFGLIPYSPDEQMCFLSKDFQASG
jgi:hypothetical protein